MSAIVWLRVAPFYLRCGLDLTFTYVEELLLVPEYVHEVLLEPGRLLIVGVLGEPVPPRKALRMAAMPGPVPMVPIFTCST